MDNNLYKILIGTYEEREAKAIFYRLMEDKYGLSRTDICLGAMDALPSERIEEVRNDLLRMAQGVPVQYVTGVEYFCGLPFAVEEGVLIPRPETEELVDWIVADAKGYQNEAHAVDGTYENPASQKRMILDIGCGSGAISVSIAHGMPQAKVVAWDVSETALRLTAQNAESNGVAVDVRRQDALAAPVTDVDVWDIIVSNPPYICDSEKETMARNVLDYEPSLALFVPDDSPLLFYAAIADYASHSLKKQGRLYFEINEQYGENVTEMLRKIGFADVELRQDQFGKDRMVKCVKI